MSDYYVTHRGRALTIRNAKSGIAQHVYYVDHDVQDVQVDDDRFYAIGSTNTTIFRRTGSSFSFSRAAVRHN